MRPKRCCAGSKQTGAGTFRSSSSCPSAPHTAHALATTTASVLPPASGRPPRSTAACKPLWLSKSKVHREATGTASAETASNRASAPTLHSIVRRGQCTTVQPPHQDLHVAVGIELEQTKVQDPALAVSLELALYEEATQRARRDAPRSPASARRWSPSARACGARSRRDAACRGGAGATGAGCAMLRLPRPEVCPTWTRQNRRSSTAQPAPCAAEYAMTIDARTHATPAPHTTISSRAHECSYHFRKRGSIACHLASSDGFHQVRPVAASPAGLAERGNDFDGGTLVRRRSRPQRALAVASASVRARGRLRCGEAPVSHGSRSGPGLTSSREAPGARTVSSACNIRCREHVASLACIRSDYQAAQKGSNRRKHVRWAVVSHTRVATGIELRGRVELTVRCTAEGCVLEFAWSASKSR